MNSTILYDTEGVTVKFVELGAEDKHARVDIDVEAYCGDFISVDELCKFIKAVEQAKDMLENHNLKHTALE